MMYIIISAFCSAVFIVGELLCEKRINKLESIIKKQQAHINRLLQERESDDT